MHVINYLISDVDYSSAMPPAYNQRMYFVTVSVYGYIPVIKCHYCYNVNHCKLL